MSEVHKEVIRRYLEAINTGNLSILDEFIHPKYIYRSPGEELHGPEGVKGIIGAFRTAFPDLNMQVDDLVIGFHFRKVSDTNNQ